MKQRHVDRIKNAIGRTVMADALGVTTGAIDKQVASGLFPSSWYVVVRAMGQARGIHVPEEAFRWIEPAAEIFGGQS